MCRFRLVRTNLTISSIASPGWGSRPAEDFWRYIGKSEVPLEEPGHLSAVTVAKGIEYGVKLLGCFIEGYVGSNQGLGKEADCAKITQRTWSSRAALSVSSRDICEYGLIVQK